MKRWPAAYRRALLKALVGAPMAMAVAATPAELVVVVNARSGVESLSRDQVVNIFMGRHRLFPHGGRAVPLDAPADSPERAQFYRLLINKEPQDVNAYWARLIFTGRTQPPLEQPSIKAVIDRVEMDPYAIAYLDDSLLTRNMQMVMKLGASPESSSAIRGKQ